MYNISGHIRNIRRKTVLKVVCGTLLTPVILVLVLGIAIYLPPVQKFVVDRACAYVSEETGMEARIGGVHLSFPLNFCIEDMICTKQNDCLPQQRDTIADIRKAIVDVQLLPLFSSNIKINTIEFNQAKINTADLIHEARIKGFVSRLMIDNTPPPVATVALDSSTVRLGNVILANSDVDVELSDTVPEDTTKKENLWKIFASNISVNDTKVAIHLPGDTLQICAALGDFKGKGGFFDLRKQEYQVSHIALQRSDISYSNNFAPRFMHGFDANHISLNGLNIVCDSIYFCNPEMRLKIRSASFNERCGLNLRNMRMDIAADSARLKVNGSIYTANSNIALKCDIKPSPVTNLDLNNGYINATIDASIGHGDIIALGSAYIPNSVICRLPVYPINIKGEAMGNLAEITIPNLTAEIPTIASIDIHGNAKGFMNLASNPYSRLFKADLHARMNTYNMSFVKSMMPKSASSTINIPAMTANADITANGPEYNVNMTAYEGKGSLKLKAAANISNMYYRADAKVNSLNLGHFIKGYGLGSLTADIKADGQGTNIMSPRTRLNATANINQLRHGKHNLSAITAKATINRGKAECNINSHNALLDGNLSLNGLLGNRKTADFTVTADINQADLYRLDIARNPLTIGICGHLDIASDLNEYYKVQGMVSDISIKDSKNTFHPDDIVVDILTRMDTTTAKIDCGDFALKMNAQGGYKRLMEKADRLTQELARQYAERTIDQKRLREAFPLANISLHSGQDNPFYRFIKYFDIDFNLIDADIRTSKEDGIFGNLTVHGLETQGIRLDTITANLKSSNDPYEIFYNGHIQNSKPNDIVFEAYFDGKLLEHGIDINTQIYDAEERLILKAGAEATMEDNGIRLHLTPKHPVLGYENFTLHDDNYILLSKTNRIHADINLLADDGTGIKVYCTDDDSEIYDEDSGILQDITLSVNHLNLGNILASLPYAPAVKGILNGDFHIMQNSNKSLVLASDLNVADMIYEGCPIGNIGSEFTYLPKEDGTHYIDGIITMDDKQVGAINGSYDSKSEAIDAILDFEEFPMQIVNGFIPDHIIGLDGTAEGKLMIQGTTTKPDINGELFLQDAALLSVPYGVRLRFDDDPVRIQNSKLLIENFQMYAPNDEPLLAYGNIDFADMDHIMVNLMMKANNFQLINAPETRYSEAYGSMYVNIMAFIRGELNKLMVRGKLDVLPSTNLYYILKDSPITTDNRLKELVTFTDLSSDEEVSIVRPTVDGIDMQMDININEGAHVKCWLNADHSNFLDLIGEGSLRMAYAKEEIKLTGRYTISEGEMKYSLPVIPLKTFTITSGSYLEWFGDMMNPRLNITAKETMKSAVNLNGVNQMVTFNTGIVLSKTLNDMGLEFIVEAPENQAVSDELNMKSAEERGKLAVTLLTTGMYLTDGNTSSFSMNSALNSFLQSEINNIAGNALKTIDLSFGMESSTEQDGTMHNDYTFKFAKRFWNNRLSISVGGKISSGPDVSGQNKSFFNNVELQYRLSDVSNKYLQLFYKRSVYDYLEGYLGQYGAGYLWKKKAQTFKEIFLNSKTNKGL